MRDFFFFQTLMKEIALIVLPNNTQVSVAHPVSDLLQEDY